MKLRGKRSHQKVAKTSISLPPTLYDFAVARVKSNGYTGLSGYLQDLLRREYSART